MLRPDVTDRDLYPAPADDVQLKRKPKKATQLFTTSELFTLRAILDEVQTSLYAPTAQAKGSTTRVTLKLNIVDEINLDSVIAKLRRL